MPITPGKHFLSHSPIWEIVLHTLCINLWFVNNEAKSPCKITGKQIHSFKWRILFTRNTLSQMHYHCSCWLAKVQLTEMNNLCYKKKVRDISCHWQRRDWFSRVWDCFLNTHNSSIEKYSSDIIVSTLSRFLVGKDQQYDCK